MGTWAGDPLAAARLVPLRGGTVFAIRSANKAEPFLWLLSYLFPSKKGCLREEAAFFELKKGHLPQAALFVVSML